MKVAATICIERVAVGRVVDPADAPPGQPVIDNEKQLWLNGRCLGEVLGEPLVDVERMYIVGVRVPRTRLISTTLNMYLELPTP